MTLHEVGIFVRSEAQLSRAEAAAEAAQLKFKVLDKNVVTVSGYGSISTMHLAKVLEFRAVVVMACDDEVITLQERICEIGDDADLKEIYDIERHLLFIACTPAREIVCWWQAWSLRLNFSMSSTLLFDSRKK